MKNVKENPRVIVLFRDAKTKAAWRFHGTATMHESGTIRDQVMPMTVREIKEKTVVMDLNHPLAGKTLVFDVKVVDIQPAPPPPTTSKSAPPAQPGAPTKPSAPPQK